MGKKESGCELGLFMSLFSRLKTKYAVYGEIEDSGICPCEARLHGERLIRYWVRGLMDLRLFNSEMRETGSCPIYNPNKA